MNALVSSLLIVFSAASLLVAGAEVGSANDSVSKLQGEDKERILEMLFDPTPDQAGQCKGSRCAAGGSY